MIGACVGREEEEGNSHVLVFPVNSELPELHASLWEEEGEPPRPSLPGIVWLWQPCRQRLNPSDLCWWQTWSHSQWAAMHGGSLEASLRHARSHQGREGLNMKNIPSLHHTSSLRRAEEQKLPFQPDSKRPFRSCYSWLRSVLRIGIRSSSASPHHPYIILTEIWAI